MRTVTTKHPHVGYIENVEIIEAALREKFGFTDASYTLRAVAVHIWSTIPASATAPNKTWDTSHVLAAIKSVRARLDAMEEQAGEI